MLVDLHASISSLLAFGQHNLEQFGNSVAFRGGPLDFQRHQDGAVFQGDVQLIVAGLFRGNLLIADAFSVLAAFGVEHPAISYQQFNCLFRIELVGVQVLFQPVLGFLVLPQAWTVGAIDDAAPALGEGVGKFSAVEQFCDSLAYRQELGGAKIALEEDGAKAGTVELHILEATLLVDDVQRSVHSRAIGDGVIEVEVAQFDGVRPGRIFGFDEDNPLNGWLLAFKIALVAGVDFKCRLF